MLRVLLLPLGPAGPAPGPSQVALSGLRPPGLCCLLCQDGLHVSSLCGSRGEAHISGSFSHFLWGSSESNVSSELLALSTEGDLCAYELSTQHGQCEAHITWRCNRDTLRKLLAAKSIALPSALSVRILSFEAQHCLLLLNNCVLAKLGFPGRAVDLQVLACLPLRLSAQIVDGHYWQRMLFLLDGSGWIYVYDTQDGIHLAAVDLTLCQAAVAEKSANAGSSLFTALRVSRDLDVAVVSSSSSSVIAVDLNMYFRQHPEHLLCKSALEKLPTKQAEGSDDDDLSSSSHSLSLLQSSFQMDRSWEARLSSLYKITKRSDTTARAVTVHVPWYGSLPNQPSRTASPAVSPQEKLLGRVWKKIHVEESAERAGIHCLSVTSFTALFMLRMDNQASAVVLWDLETEEVTYCALDRACTPVNCGGEEQSCLIYTDDGLSVILFGVTQDEFLNRLMAHGTAGTVDSLCHLNRWGRCSIPIHALEAGLENHQLDMVDFFLKSKENLFSLPASDATELSQRYLTNVEELRAALDLLCRAIRESNLETQSKQFSEQLLNLTLSFLNKQIQQLCSCTDEFDENLQVCVDILSSYIIELRTFMKRLTQKKWCIESVGEVPWTEQSHLWDTFTLQEAIMDAILNNKILEVQTFFRLNRNMIYSLAQLIQVGLSLVYDCLLRSSTEEASKLLKNMGFCVNEELHKICLYTSDKGIRDLLVTVLEEENYFPEREREMIAAVHHIESLYLGASCERKASRALHRSWRTDQDVARHTVLLDSFLTCDGKNKPASRDFRVILHWVQWWDQSVQEEILLSKQSGRGKKVGDPRVLWRHLTCRHAWQDISSWVEECWPQDRQRACPPLTPDIVDENTLCSSYMRNRVLDSMARYGVFIQSEMEDFEQLLLRLSCAGRVMQRAHPVPQCWAGERLDFHSHFILYCLERSLQQLLYAHLDYYSLTPSNCPILSSKELYEAHPWFEFLVQIRGVASNPRDAQLIFQASLANAQILIPSSQAAVSSMLLEGHTLLALATTVYAPGGMNQVFGQKEETETDPQLLKMALAPYPKLKAALFPQTQGLLPADISLYHLIQALSPFDPARLFGWQSANTLAIGGKSDISSDLPHFSSRDLVNKYAVLERMDFSYYLRHGRPSFAFATFLVQQLAKSKSPKQLIQQAGDEAYALGLASFDVPSIGAACLGFLECLGLDSLKLRVDVKVANLILSHKIGSEEATRLRSSLEKLCGLVEHERACAEELLVGLQDAVEGHASRVSSEASQQWDLVMKFCKIHAIELNPQYLRVCARAHDWLQFIVQIQTHNFQPEQVKSALKDFSPTLQYHLGLAFENLQCFSPSGMEQEFCGEWAPPGASCRMSEGRDTECGEPGPAGASGVFHVLLQCQEELDVCHFLLVEAMRQRAPILSVLAACLKGTSVVQCVCVWVITSLDEDTGALATAHVEGLLEGHQWNLHDLSLLWKTLLAKQKSKILIRGFQLFLKDCPLLHMLEVYELCMDYQNYSNATQKLQDFQKCLVSLKRAGEGGSSSVLPVPWLESHAVFLLELMLQQCRTHYELGKLLHLFADSEDILISTGPDVRKLCALSQILEGTWVSIDRTILLHYSPDMLQQECSRVIQQLQERGAFLQARKVAELAQLPVDNLLIQEMLWDLQILKTAGHWKRNLARVEFWKKCHESFTHSCVSAKVASGFFLAQAHDVPGSPVTQMDAVTEKHLLLTLAGHWLAGDDSVLLQELENLERELWVCRITRQTLLQEDDALGPKVWHLYDSVAEQFTFSRLAALNMRQYLSVADLPCQDMLRSPLAERERDSLSSLIGQLLDKCCVHEASRVCRYFSFYHKDLSLLLHCRALAAGTISSKQLPPDMQAVLRSRDSSDVSAGARRRRLHSASSLESFSSNVTGHSSDDQVLRDLEILTDECFHGKNYCQQVLCLYELSQELLCSYSELSSQDARQVLEAILCSQQPQRCQKAQGFISTQHLEPQVVAELITESILRELMEVCEGTGHKQDFNPLREKQTFQQLAKLCADPTLVGIQAVEKLSSVPYGELACTVELLIFAHDCFTLTCHLEGITRVLQASRHLTNQHLAPNDEHMLMVRLLTGIGRYNDMNYIFDILHRKHHFEVLMRKKLDSTGGLMTALLDYIKRCHPGDSEKHNMVALCFSMHREIGENHQAAALIQLKLIESQPWEESLADILALKAALMKVLTLLIDAAESYRKESCVRQSLRCSRLTKLITLQLHFLNNDDKTKLINLSSDDVMDCIIALPRFHQASVVAEAYDIVPDWAEVLFQRVLIKGDFGYLEEVKQQQLLKSSVFEDISRKYRSMPSNAVYGQNLKKLLSSCDDIAVYYKLAYDNQFYDVVNLLLKHPQTGCCLNDMLGS
ncbi:spatacsin-like isoform X2 [Rhinatrema bivittatum]|uniref:spatacsin-like isoform X2 n=1 Tax=Rhinatrema bivittatum TaxID=194408 RepID=UPI00112E17F3|nr:spatacsin-like isoform X2 [Rhinatrema bivittatum]